MASEQKPARKTVDTVGSVLGLLVFVAGIAMIAVVFTMVRGVFDGVDQQMAAVRMASAQAADTVTATPGTGPTFSEVGITVGLKMLGLLVLGWLSALVSSKGAQLAGAYGSKRE